MSSRNFPPAPKSVAMYQVFEHTADVGLNMEAATAAELLAEAARGLTSLLTPDVAAIASIETVQFTVEADEWPLVLFDVLSEVLHLFESRRLLFNRFGVTVTGMRADVTATGEPLDPARHRFGQEVKAITYHELMMRQVEQSETQENHNVSSWVGRVIVDI